MKRLTEPVSIDENSMGEPRCTEGDEAIAFAANGFISGKCEESRE